MASPVGTMQCHFDCASTARKCLCRIVPMLLGATYCARTSIMFMKPRENIKNRMVTKMPESQNMERKSKWKDEYLEWICGYANAQGGKIFIGCDDEGNVVGLLTPASFWRTSPTKSGTRWALLSASTCWTRKVRNISRSTCRRIPSVSPAKVFTIIAVAALGRF